MANIRSGVTVATMGDQAQFEYSDAIASGRQQPHQIANSQFATMQQQQQQQIQLPQPPLLQPAAAQANVQPQSGYSQNLFYATSSLQPLMVPPPSPTVLSYYTADPTYWISLLGQHAYQPQAYHYEYPVAAHQHPHQHQHQLPHQFNSTAHQQLSTLGYGVTNMQSADPLYSTQQQQQQQQQQLQGASLPPIDQSMHQSNIVAAQMVAAAAAAAVASGQYPASGHPLQAGVPNSAGVGLPYNAQGSIVGNFGGFASQKQQSDAYGQPSRRSSSFTNLSLLQQQSSPNSSISFMQPGINAQFQPSSTLHTNTGAVPQLQHAHQHQAHQHQHQHQHQQPVFGGQAQMFASNVGSATAASGIGLFQPNASHFGAVNSHGGLASAGRTSLATH
ncbi:hypothetical protein LPJ57_009889, partial [Coemansia sp. RSA 486]